MSDYNSGLPIRSQADGADERVHVKIVDGTTPSQRAIVDSDSNVHTEAHGNDPAGTDRVLRTSEQGSVSVDGIYHAANNSDPSQVGLVAHTRAATPADSDQTQRLTAITNGAVHAMDMSLHDEDGAAYSDANPLPVYLANDPGTETVNYNTAAAVAAAGTSNHDLAIAASTTIELYQIWVAASGKCKAELRYTTDGSTFTTLAVGFNSTANPNIDLSLSKPFVLAGSATTSLRIVRTNLDNQAQDLYSTIIGIVKS